MQKRSISAFIVALVIAITAFVCVSCVDDDPPAKGEEAGIYTYTQAEVDYELELDGFNSFTMAYVDGEYAGTYSVEKEQIKLKFDGASTPVAVTSSNGGAVLTFRYSGVTYVCYKQVDYTVNFNSNGGSAVSAATARNGKTVVKPANPQKNGYAFVDWYVDEALTQPYSFATPVIGDMTLYAKYVQTEAGQAEFNVTFQDGNKTLEVKKTANGQIENLPVPVKENEIFLGWWYSNTQDASKLTAQYKAGVRLAADTTLFAVWQSEFPAVSAYEKKVVWTSKNLGAVTLEIVDPDGKKVAKPLSMGTVEYAYDFAAGKAGEYAVTVTVDGKSTTVYYNNKALDRVSQFSVENNVLTFSGVANAQKYLLTVSCGTAEHTHTDMDLGANTSYDFSNCDMKVGGITFVVTAVAEGYGSSVSDPFVYENNLSAVESIAYNGETGMVSWAAVQNATSYVVEIRVDGETDIITVTDPVVSVKNYIGSVSIKITAQAKGYNASVGTYFYSADPALPAPQNLKLVGNDLIWDAVDGAQTYNVKIGPNVRVSNENKITLAASDFVGAGAMVSVQAVGSNGTSLYSDEEDVRVSAMADTVTHKNGKISWSYVLGAVKYGVRVNGGAEIVVDGGVNEVAVTLTKAGANTVSVYFYNAQNVASASVSATVNAHTVTFKANGEEVGKQYYATGDAVSLLVPDAETGFTFAGWYNVENGITNNGQKFTDESFLGMSDMVLFADWKGKEYELSLVADKTNTFTETVVFKQDYSLPVPVSKDGSLGFKGWYTAENGGGIQYTDASGNSLRPWNTASGSTLYAAWVTALKFQLIRDNTGKEVYAVVKGADIGLVTEVTIPATYNGKKVTTVEAGAFEGCTKLTTVTLPSSIENVVIGFNGINSAGSAFSACSAFTTFRVYEVEGEEQYYDAVDGMLVKHSKDINSNSYTPDGDVVELVCIPTSLKGEFTVPSVVTAIPANVFNQSKVSKVVVPASVTQVGQRAFTSCASLKEVEFLAPQEGEAVKELVFGAEVFYDCVKLDKVILPARMVNFDIGLFAGSYNLTTIELAGESDAYATKAGTLCTADGKTILYCPRGYAGEFTIPAGVTTIGPEAFADCDLITSLTVPGFVEEIGVKAFRDCDGLIAIKFLGEEGDPALAIRDGAFYSAYSALSSSIQELVLPANLVVLEQSAFGAIVSLKSVVINTTSPDIQFAIGAFAVRSGSGDNVVLSDSYLVTATLGPKVAKFDVAGVLGAKYLDKINVDRKNPNYSSVSDVLYNKDRTEILFYPLTKEGAFALPSTVTKIGDNVFANRSLLTEITIPAGVSKISDNAFRYCNSLTAVRFAGGDEVELELVIGNYAFANCTSLESIYLPKRTVSIGNYAFYRSKMTEIRIPEKVASIGDYAFNGCLASTVTIPSNVKTIGAYAFANCNNLQEFIMEEGVTSLGYYCFDYSSALTEITLPASLTVLGDEENGMFPFGVATNDHWYQMRNVYVADGNPAFKSIDGVLYAIDEQGNPVTLIYFPTKKTGTVSIPKTVSHLYDKAFQNSRVGEIVFPEGVQNGLTFGEDVFVNSSYLTRIQLPEGMTAIGNGLFQGCESVTEIVIPSTVTTIAPNAFRDCKSLTTLTFAPTAQGATAVPLTFEDCAASSNLSAFFGCSNLTEIVLPERTVKIGNYAFARVGSLTKVVIPASVTEIGDYAFYSNKYLTTVEVVDDSQLATIGQYAFAANAKLTAISLPATVITLGKAAFEDCEELSCVTFADGIKLAEISASAFSNTGLLSVEIPASVTTIGEFAFEYTTHMETVTFEQGSKLSEIGDQAFRYSTIKGFSFPDVEQVVTVEGAEGEEPTTQTQTAYVTLGDTIFENCRYLTEVHISKSLNNTAIEKITESCYSIKKFTISNENVYFKMDVNTNLITSKPADDKTSAEIYYGYGNVAQAPSSNGGVVTIPGDVFDQDGNLVKAGVIKIGAYAFDRQADIKKVVIPASVQEISDYAFRNCINLEEVVFEEGSKLIKIGKYAFYGNEKLKKIEVPASVAEIGNNAFYRCYALEEAVFYSDITFGTQIFWDCSSLKRVVLFGEQSALGNQMFYGCSSLTEIEIPQSVTKIGTGVFTGTGLTEVTVVGDVPASLYKNCKSLTKVTFIPGADGKMTVGANAFEGCSALTELVGAETITSLGNSAFSAAGVVSINLSSVAGTLGQKAFLGCEKLEEVEFGSNEALTAIGASAFEACKALKQITLPDSIKTLNASVFEESGLTSFVVPAATTKFGNYIFQNCVDLLTVEFHTSFKTLGTYSFSGCTSLVSLENCGSMTTLANFAFTNCSSLKEFVAPKVTNKKTNNWKNCFEGCSSLERFETGALLCLGDQFFYGCSSLKEYDLSDVQRIRKEAFAYSGLTSVTVPAATDLYGKAVFMGCASLTELTLLSGVEDIPDQAFDGCVKLATIYGGDTVTDIGYRAFAKTALTRVSFPAAEKMYPYAFKDCVNLVSAEVPNATYAYKMDSVTYESLQGGYFDGCINLQSATINTEWRSLWDVSFYENMFRANQVMKVFEIPEGITSLSTNLFADTAIEELILPNSLTTISYGALSCMPNLKKITVKDGNTNFVFDTVKDESGADRTLIYQADGTLIFCPTDYVGKVVLKDDATGVATKVFENCKYVTSVDLKSVTTLAYQALVSPYLTEIEIPQSVTSFGTNLFAGSTSLSKVTIPDTMTYIPNSMFYKCKALKQISLPASVTSIHVSAFEASGLTSIEIPDTVTEIGPSAFANCASLSSVKMSKNVTDYTVSVAGSMGRRQFVGCSSLTSFTFPAGTTALSDEMFQGSGLKEIVIPDTVTYIGKTVFQGCAQLNKVTLGKGITDYVEQGIGIDTKLPMGVANAIFGDCVALKTVVIPDTVTALSPMMFAGSGIETIRLPESLKSINYRLFMNCASLKEIVIPDNVETIYGNAFASCTALESVTFGKSVTTLSGEGVTDTVNKEVFASCTALKVLNVPAKLTELVSCDLIYGCTDGLVVNFELSQFEFFRLNWAIGWHNDVNVVVNYGVAM